MNIVVLQPSMEESISHEGELTNTIVQSGLSAEDAKKALSDAEFVFMTVDELPPMIEEMRQRFEQSGLFSYPQIRELWQSESHDEANESGVEVAESVLKKVLSYQSCTREVMAQLLSPHPRPLVIEGDQPILEIRRLGEGSFAKVSLIQHEDAIKVMKRLKPHHDPKLQKIGEKRFAREIRLVKKLKDAGVPEILGSGGEDTHQPYYFMKYQQGRDLGQILKVAEDTGQRLPPRLVCDMGLLIADTMANAHAEGIFHRDLKPSNILIGDDGRIWILDWGLAALPTKQEEDFSKLTQTGQTFGTTPYMSPEQIQNPRNARGWTDVYSLACVIYQALTGKYPFPGETAQDVLAKHVNPQYMPDMAAIRSVNSELADMLLEAMHKQDKLRPTMENFRQMLFEHTSFRDRYQTFDAFGQEPSQHVLKFPSGGLEVETDLAIPSKFTSQQMLAALQEMYPPAEKLSFTKKVRGWVREKWSGAKRWWKNQPLPAKVAQIFLASVLALGFYPSVSAIKKASAEKALIARKEEHERQKRIPSKLLRIEREEGRWKDIVFSARTPFEVRLQQSEAMQATLNGKPLVRMYFLKGDQVQTFMRLDTVNELPPNFERGLSVFLFGDPAEDAQVLLIPTLGHLIIERGESDVFYYFSPKQMDVLSDVFSCLPDRDFFAHPTTRIVIVDRMPENPLIECGPMPASFPTHMQLFTPEETRTMVRNHVNLFKNTVKRQMPIRRSSE